MGSKRKDDQSALREVEKILGAFGAAEEVSPPRQTRHAAAGTDYGAAAKSFDPAAEGLEGLPALRARPEDQPA